MTGFLETIYILGLNDRQLDLSSHNSGSNLLAYMVEMKWVCDLSLYFEFEFTPSQWRE